MTNDEVIKKFFTTLLENQTDLPYEFKKVLDEHFWDLFIYTEDEDNNENL